MSSMLDSSLGPINFLSSYIDFRQHIEQLYEDLNNVEKGKKFAELVKDTLSSHENYWGLDANLNEKQSHDGGVDIIWRNPETQEDSFYCQSKFKIRSKDDFDNVMSKFRAIDEKAQEIQEEKQLDLALTSQSDVSEEKHQKDSEQTKFVVATLWNLQNILKKYQDSGMASVNFYQRLLKDDRLEIIDGEKLYNYFLDAYQKEYSIPQEIRFESREILVNRDNVHVGIISAKDLIEIYKKTRNGIFFENVRDFIGLGNSDSALDINNEIYKTAKNEPFKMIERNNGITFKAGSIEYDKDWVVLSDAGIINGCQTTICIVKAMPTDECYVPVKIVVTGTNNVQKSSDIARTSNTQNRIDKINLELSEFIRPQLIKMSLSEAGISLLEDESRSAPILAATISKYQIFKSDIRYLFIGLFSYSPRNVFNSDYTSIRFDDLKNCFSNPNDKVGLNSILARLLVESNKQFEKIKLNYPVISREENEQEATGAKVKVGKVFNRFYIDQKGYKAYLIILAVYCMMEIDDEKSVRNQKIVEIISFIKNILDNNLEEYQTSLNKIFKAIAMNVVQKFSAKDRDLEDEISQNLFKYMRSTNFSAFYMVYGMLDS